MNIKDQIKTVKENWLIASLLIVIVMIPLLSSPGALFQGLKIGGSEMMISDAAYDSYARSSMPYSGEGFAPEIEERKITTHASLSSEVERGSFQDTQARMKAIMSASNSILLSENVDAQDVGRKSYLYGYYTFKVETPKYDAIVAQLKEVGEIRSFNENRQDITESYTNIQVELEAERARLARYREMLAQAMEVADKIELSDRIFNQERTVKYLEDALRNQDQQVTYSTISVQLSEKRSEYADVAVLKFSELIASLVSSFNNLLQLLFVALPYALVLTVLWLVVREVRNRK